jgi:hypothetical protein
MRTTLRITALIAIAVVVVITVVAAAASQDPDTPVTSTPGASAPGTPEPQVVQPRPGMTDVIPSAFDTAKIGADDVTLTITFWAGIEPCSVLDHVDVDEAPGSVTVTLYVGSDPSAGNVACPELAVRKQVTVTLDHALAGRDIVDGAVAR